MILILNRDYEERQFNMLINWLEAKNIDPRVWKGTEETIVGLIGDTSSIDTDMLESMDIVNSVRRVSEPYKSSNRKFHPHDTLICTGGAILGDGNFGIIAGPCSVESEEQLCLIAEKVKTSGATFLRGGAFKPRTSPYAFQGLRQKGIELLLKAKEKTGLPIVTEIMDISHIPLFEDVDVIQVGARNMQNFELLKELGHLDKPVLIKRGLANTVDELLMSAEYIMSGGNEKVILCERGIRTFEQKTRNTLDLSAVPLLKSLSHLPVVVDPSHATGIAKLVEPMAMAATACGADGLMIEVHNDPQNASCDGQQSLTPEAFERLVNKVKEILPHAYKI